ncbi:MAG: hypothetical protein JST40_08035 [Armatimonadetes bacterium]|nr:hypothetical protein [Armatimonadota bacterium]
MRFLSSALLTLSLAAPFGAWASLPEGVFLIDSINQGTSNPQGTRVARFDLNANYLGDVIGPGRAEFQTPQIACEGPNDTYLVSDQGSDSVHQYALDGTYLGEFITGVDNLRGITRRRNGNYLLALGAAGVVAEYSPNGTYIRDFASVPSAWFALELRNGDVLVSSSQTFSGGNTPKVRRYDSSGTFVSDFCVGYPFTQQIHEMGNGHILISVFSIPQSNGKGNGIYEFLPDGTEVFKYNLDGSRGCMELGDGSIIGTGGTVVRKFAYGVAAGTDLTGFGGTLQSNWRLIYSSGFPVPVSGKIELSEFLGDPSSQTYDVEVRNSQGAVVQTPTLSVANDGSFKFTTTRRGQFSLAVKTSHFLRKNVAFIIDNYGATLGNVVLLNGDVDGDNFVTIFDYLQLSTAFDSDSSSSNWDPAADLDGDGSVTIFDYLILSNNFDLGGDD